MSPHASPLRALRRQSLECRQVAQWSETWIGQDPVAPEGFPVILGHQLQGPLDIPHRGGSLPQLQPGLAAEEVAAHEARPLGEAGRQGGLRLGRPFLVEQTGGLEESGGEVLRLHAEHLVERAHGPVEIAAAYTVDGALEQGQGLLGRELRGALALNFCFRISAKLLQLNRP
jgi:hypothetical protein